MRTTPRGLDDAVERGFSRTSAVDLEWGARAVERALGASPEAETTLERIGVVAETDAPRQLRQSHGVASPHHDVVRFQRSAQGLDDGANLFAPLANAQAVEPLQAHVVLIGATLLVRQVG